MADSPIVHPPEDKWTDIEGLSFHYRDWGGSGQPVVLLHGLASNCRIWDLVAPVLARKHAVVALDQRGHGQTDKPDHGYDFASVSRDVAGFIAAMGLASPIVIGHSWGGDVALQLAVECPDLVKGLGFVDGGMIDASARYPTLDEALIQMAPPVFAGMTVAEFRERISSRPHVIEMGPAAADIVPANFQELEDGTIRANLSRENHLRIIEALWDHHPRELYPKVGCPVLIMPARQQSDPTLTDRVLSRASSVAAATKLLPTSKAVWLEDSIHDVPIQRPELVAGVIKDHIAQGFFGA